MSRAMNNLANYVGGTALAISLVMSSNAMAADTEPTNLEEQLTLCQKYLDVDKDPDKALKYCEAAAHQGHKGAQSVTANIYQWRTGQHRRAEDFEKQMYWYKQGLYGRVDDPGMLMYAIGNSYMGFEMARGKKLSNDGYAWFRIAALYGHEKAARAVKSLEPQFTPENVDKEWDGDAAELEKLFRSAASTRIYLGEMEKLIEIYGTPWK